VKPRRLPRCGLTRPPTLAQIVLSVTKFGLTESLLRLVPSGRFQAIGTRCMRLFRRRDTSQETPERSSGSRQLQGRTIAATLTERVRPGIKAAEALHFLFELSHQA
jgi:hypothetical protein